MYPRSASNGISFVLELTVELTANSALEKWTTQSS
jgi:hypothetical protein